MVFTRWASARVGQWIGRVVRGVDRRLRIGVGCGVSCWACRGMARKSESGVAGVVRRRVGGEVRFRGAQVRGCLGRKLNRLLGDAVHTGVGCTGASRDMPRCVAGRLSLVRSATKTRSRRSICRWLTKLPRAGVQSADLRRRLRFHCLTEARIPKTLDIEPRLYGQISTLHLFSGFIPAIGVDK